MPKRVIIAVSTDIVTDQRVLRMAGLIAESRADITILGRELAESLPVEDMEFKVQRWKMVFRTGFLFYKWFNIRIFFYLISNKADLIVSNDLDTLLPCYIVSKLKRVNLIFDSHEYFTGSPELKNRHFVRLFWKNIERKTLPYLNYVMTVNKSISDLYHKEYGIDAVVVRNISEKHEIHPINRSELGLSDNDLILILQGTGINIDRGGEELVEAMKQITGVHLLIIGKGDALGMLREMSQSPDLKGKITFLPAMPWNQMMRYTGMADAGLSLDKGDSLNYKLSLPNKIFDYINAGIALIVSNLPEVKKVVDLYGCGLLIDKISPETITERIIQIRDDRSLLEELKNNSLIASGKLSWEVEKQKAKALYKSAGLEYF
jgi:glycosyltransferase involved in cell wall biosynthesis